ncbi:serine hydrolase [Nostoc sp. FACHB-87]|uniref:serine hydrolase n=1 Tax=Nostocaceae TaxID=1162 RepID=UPI001688D15E|nr:MULTISPECIES: serine hydrolase [Nostocaceae]MBD2456685.1 serine hydrolase [Nostoc sp. FACHB-87]MBD2478061.1 serine hydrolase [Anabaena sp. FACHB-83]
MNKIKIIRKSKPSLKVHRVAFLLAIPISILVIVLRLINNQTTQESDFENKATVQSNICSKTIELKLTDNSSISLTPSIIQNERICYRFYGEFGHKLYLQSNANVTLINPSNSAKKLQLTNDKAEEIILKEAGNYSISVLDKDIKSEPIIISLQSSVSSIPPSPSVNQTPMKLIAAYDYNQNNTPIYSPLTYKPSVRPNFYSSNKLEEIVKDIVVSVHSKGLPTNRLSISLIDLKTSECCAYAGYSDQEPRFPASVVKLFWMAYLYGQYESGFIAPGTIPYKQLQKMIQDSDNESASLIVDTVTRTKSGDNLTGYELQEWIQNRLVMNLFFQQAGYNNINISQKVFPTKQFQEPVGRDLQIRISPSHPIRDYVTTFDVARLLLEIEHKVSISKKYSIEMKKLLKRDLRPEAWKNKDFNAIEGFLGEGLPQDADFASKMGWNFNTRNDAAIIGSPDGKYKYILVIFGDDPSFYKDRKLLPKLSRMVYEKMVN